MWKKDSSPRKQSPTSNHQPFDQQSSSVTTNHRRFPHKQAGDDQGQLTSAVLMLLLINNEILTTDVKPNACQNKEKLGVD